MSKVTTPEEAARLVRDGDTVTWSGAVGFLNPESVLGALEARFLSEGHPANLTGFEPCSTSRGAGLEHFAREGFMKRLVTSHLGVDSNPG
ncbi:MAG: acyl CoA:acetate/3-ketoacid CoA transferase, partial [Chloroflexi bacterium]|nr:acyl CoA:acetate/3-ketoacid CoA transferase [Chloroflexota bacterium]